MELVNKRDCDVTITALYHRSMLRWSWAMHRGLSLAMLMVLAGGCVGQSADHGGEPDIGAVVTAEGRYRVIRVVDGDTLVVGYDGETRVRVLGIDTPEIAHPQGRPECGGRQASKAAHRLLDGTVVGMAFSSRGDRRDQYDRLLAYITLPDGTDYGETMLRRGYADVFYAQRHPRESGYRAAKAAAKKADRGLWGFC